MKKLLTALFVVSMAFATMHAEAAKRLGGGKSMGQQSSNVTQREAVKPAPAATPNAAPTAAPAAPHAQRRPPRNPPDSVAWAACWAAWPRVWAWPGWPTPLVLAPSLVNS